jgi:hypothetical protein
MTVYRTGHPIRTFLLASALALSACGDNDPVQPPQSTGTPGQPGPTGPQGPAGPVEDDGSELPVQHSMDFNALLAYREIVREQGFIRGRDATVEPVANVHRELSAIEGELSTGVEVPVAGPRTGKARVAVERE